MNTLEEKMDAVMRLVTADNETEYKKAMKDVRKLLDDAPTAKRDDAETMVRGILLELGAPDHLLGHPYVVQAVLLVIHDQMYINNITSGLYPQLAAHFDTTASRVERAIRHLIEVTWTRGDPEVLDKYFGNTVSMEKGKPTNGEFIARIANVVKLRMKNAV